jgi:hypothetical protein
MRFYQEVIVKKKSEDNIAKYPNSIDTRVALLEQSIGHINDTLIRIENNNKEFRRDVKSDFRWVIGIMIAFGSGLMGVMAHGFKWF